MTEDTPLLPSFSDDEVLAGLRAAGARGLTHTRQGQGDLFKWGWDIQSVNAIVADCTSAELWNHELSHNYPEFNDYVAWLKVDLEDQAEPFYVKIALHLPNIKQGELLSFHPWGYQR